MNGVKLYLNRCMMALFVLLSASASTASDTKQMQFDKIVLPYDANVVESVCKDSLGMMWFATRRGLFSYDGYNIRRLYEGRYYAVLIVDEETLCLGGDAGLRWLNLRTEQFVTPFGDVPEIGEVRSLKCDNGVLYVGTKSNGLFCLDLDKRIWQRYTLPSGKDDIIYSIEPVNDRLYVAHYGGLACLDNKGGIFDLGIDDNVYALWYDRPNGNLWIGTEHHLLCQNVKDSTTKVVASGSTFNQIVPSPSGDILLASEFGLKILNPQSGIIQTIGHDASSPQGLPSNTIHQIYCDDDIIWIATDRGVAITQSESVFETTTLPSITHSNDGNVFSRILVDSSGGRWMGGDNGLLHLSDHGNKWFKVGNGLKKSIIRSIYEDREHEIWIATDASIARYNRQRDVFDYFSLSDQKGRNANWAYDIYEDNKNRLWIATYMGGLYVVDKTALLSGNGSFILKDNQFDDVDSIVNTIYRFIPDKSGVLWANTSKGLASINTNSGKVTLKKRMYIDNMILVNDVIWIDVQGKLYKYDTQTDRLEETDFQVKDGMIQSFVHDNNRVWMSTSHGLFYIETAGNTIHFYVRPNYNFTAGSYVPSDNTILWGGEDFICKQFLNTTSSGDKPSKVFISSIMVGGIPISDCVPRFENNISLDGREDIALDLSTFAYNRKGSEVFWYKINEDGEWHSLPNGTNRILLSHLSGGSYEIYLSTDSDFKEESVSKYTIKVPYPWFFRWWAWVVYTLIALSVVYYLINYYKRRENALFEQRERERVMALTQEKMDFFVNMSHELKTPLSLIIAPLNKLLSETSNAKLRDSLKSIQNNASRLNDLIHHILDFKQLEAEGETQILSSYIDLCSLISGCISEFETSAKERNISMLFQPTETSVLMDVDVVKIQMVMRNILSNALKYADEEKGKILVSLEKRASEVLVSVQDNGPGVSDSDLPKLFNRYYMGQNSRDGSGIGLSVVKKYVELHGGEVKAENNNGLKVTFSIPLNVLTSVVTEKNIKDGTSEKPIVLIVDDNHEILDFLTTALETSYQCITAFSGEQALKTIEERIPDIIITDQMMPGIDGTELCHRIRHNHSTELIPIIMLTAKDDSNTELKSIRSGADVFMPKPFDLRKLQLHIVQLLTKRKAIEQNTRIKSMQVVNVVSPALSNDEELMERIISLINSNMHSEEFNVTKLCDLLCMDQKQLYRKLKQLTGETPVSFIRKQRLQRAAVLLKQERFTVSEVMYQVGFSSASYFSRSFAKEFGVLPKEYLFSDNIAVH